MVNLVEKLSHIETYWAPKIIGQMNDYHIKLAKFKGEFTWHDHKETDEVFYVVEGEMDIEYRNKTVHLKTGDLHIVLKGEEHKPHAEKECHVMLIEPAGTINTGESGGDQTAANDEWI